MAERAAEVLKTRLSLLPPVRMLDNLLVTARDDKSLIHVRFASQFPNVLV
jgi:hypothetical protein